MSCKTLQGKYAEKLEVEKFIINERINELYNKLDAQEDMLKQQIEVISINHKQIDMYLERLNKIKEYLKQVHIEQQNGILSSNNLIWDNIVRLCDGLEILGEKENE